MKVHTYFRDRSTRVPGKVHVEIGGEPLWRRLCLKFRGHEVFADVDSPRILAAIEGDPELAHVTAYPRLGEHAEAKEPGLAMTRRFLREFVEDPLEPIAIVHATAPFLEVATVQLLQDAVESGEYDSGATVTRIQDYAYRMTGPFTWVPLNHDGRTIPGTQQLEPLYHLNHAAFVVSRDSIERWGHRVGARPYMLATEHPENVDIDTPEDVAFARAVAALQEVA